jgi:EAL domain-containing protein (putative c-di-GMP-specific phosphodiesterase class I)
MEFFTLHIFHLGLCQLEILDLPKNLKIAFNLSAQSINTDFLSKLLECCKGYRFPINNIVLEKNTVTYNSKVVWLT